MNKQYIFTPGPVPMSRRILKIGSRQVPYFRNESFSNKMFESKKLLLKLVNAKKNSEVVFLASSGTGAMEASIINTLSKDDEAIVVNSGGFGQRFVDICENHKVKVDEIKVSKDEDINFEKIKVDNQKAFVVNAHETTIGKLFDLEKIGKFCKEKSILNIVDAISTFVCDEIDMKKQNIDVLIISSNKGLALPPGLSMVVLSPKAIKSLKNTQTLYFDFKDYISNIKRGQTPFTPPVSILLQLNERLKEIDNIGIKKVNEKTKKLAKYFRKKIKSLPYEFYVENMPNAMTTLMVKDKVKAYEIVDYFEKNYNIILTPSGGELKDKLIRVSHMGNMSKKYIDVLINHLKKYHKKD